MSILYPHQDKHIMMLLQKHQRPALAKIYHQIFGAEMPRPRTVAAGVRRLQQLICAYAGQRNLLIDGDALARAEGPFFIPMEQSMNEKTAEHQSDDDTMTVVMTDKGPKIEQPSSPVSRRGRKPSDRAPGRQPPREVQTVRRPRRGRPKGIPASQGIKATMMRALVDHAMTVEEIVDLLAKRFPDRDPDGMRNTVRITLSEWPRKYGGKVVASGDRPQRYSYILPDDRDPFALVGRAGRPRKAKQVEAST